LFEFYIHYTGIRPTTPSTIGVLCSNFDVVCSWRQGSNTFAKKTT
jgi:hypothetical protein